MAFFNPEHSRIEMHLEARQALQVRWFGGARVFAERERLHTECSYKYTPERFAGLLESAGFERPRCWISRDAGFAVYWARA